MIKSLLYKIATQNTQPVFVCFFIGFFCLSFFELGGHGTLVRFFKISELFVVNFSAE
jgi:hypothetical protein